MKAASRWFWTLGCLAVGCDPPGDTRLTIMNKSARPIYFSVTNCNSPDSIASSNRSIKVFDYERDTVIDKLGDEYVPANSIDHVATGPGGSWPRVVKANGGYLCVYFFAPDSIDLWPRSNSPEVLERRHISLSDLESSNWVITYP